MRTNDSLRRQSLGCGYEPRTDRVRLTIWQPPSGYRGPALTTCAGYTANLPEVIESAVARLHWKTGQLESWCGKRRPTEELLDAIVILDAECSALESWLMTPSKDGGGGA